jgi:hypothetical protein
LLSKGVVPVNNTYRSTLDWPVRGQAAEHKGFGDLLHAAANYLAVSAALRLEPGSFMTRLATPSA